jgi:hypothetical protein
LEACLRNNTVRLGFNTEKYFQACLNKKWNELFNFYREEGRKAGKPRDICNQVQAFYEDNGETLWITFHHGLLYWATIDPAVAPVLVLDGEGTCRPTKAGWSSNTISGAPLYMSSLAGHLTQLVGFRGTSCKFADVEYLIRRINGKRSEAAEKAECISEELKAAICNMMKLLTWQDFELLVELVFSSSGWRRLGVVGGTQKTVDMELLLPTTNERAFVQVKAKASQAEFESEYRSAFSDMKHVSRMFYIYHSGSITSNDPSITLIDQNRLSQMVMDTGLVSWLIERVS